LVIPDRQVINRCSLKFRVLTIKLMVGREEGSL